MAKREEFDKPGHFICADQCRFFKHTHVGQYCVSTVGDYYPEGSDRRDTIGCNRYLETYVFDLHKDDGGRWHEIDSSGYKHRDEAERGHEELVAKWSGIVDELDGLRSQAAKTTEEP